MNLLLLRPRRPSGAREQKWHSLKAPARGRQLELGRRQQRRLSSALALGCLGQEAIVPLASESRVNFSNFLLDYMTQTFFSKIFKNIFY